MSEDARLQEVLTCNCGAQSTVANAKGWQYHCYFKHMCPDCDRNFRRIRDERNKLNELDIQIRRKTNAS